MALVKVRYAQYTEVDVDFPNLFYRDVPTFSNQLPEPFLQLIDRLGRARRLPEYLACDKELISKTCGTRWTTARFSLFPMNLGLFCKLIWMLLYTLFANTL